MSTDLNRRAILAGAASLPAASIPAIAGDDAELLATGEKMKLLWSPYHEADAEAHEEYERAEEFLGRNRPDYAEIASKWSWEEHEANWRSAVAKTDYAAAADRWNRLGDQIVPLAEAALELEATSVAGFDVLAAAALIHGDEYSAEQDGPS
jgi:hypothetical protein